MCHINLLTIFSIWPNDRWFCVNGSSEGKQVEMIITDNRWYVTDAGDKKKKKKKEGEKYGRRPLTLQSTADKPKTHVQKKKQNKYINRGG